MMKLLLVSTLIVAAASAALPTPKAPSYTTTTSVPGSVIAILRSESDIAPDGSSYQYTYETANGISAEESGSLIPSAPEPALAARGFYHFTSPEGIPVQITYVADENGYQPSGDVLPTAHPVPLAILRSLEYIAAHLEPVVSAVPVKKY